MHLTGNTILITGGSSGIGLALSEELLKKNNDVIICGRSQEKLTRAKERLQNITTYQCDISDHHQRLKLVGSIREHHPSCNVLFNNAAIVHKTNFVSDPDMIAKAALEIATNFSAPVTLCKLFYPIIREKENPALINITTGLIYAPRATYPIYNATKTALHSFTQVLRAQAEQDAVEIVEVMFPAVDTPWHKGTPPDIAISTQEAIEGMLKGLQKGKKEIRVGKVNMLYLLSRIAPNFAFRMINSLNC
ncbi:SDR family NAD(P)-dependent oxidoreductase [Aliifodinibius sp. S!AR15-10]|uniref:SDR family oxidoreductase n=1 Tax=Aliifodinibius sp. S!AR15-10 TaxID=2950437 RepID=UPI00285AEF03|nr:SDR family NAD(P)-dependent oxidoreductase [Aliifodinibius sp. S!AR15-10]MDR8389722.1 SDR family NAD(P)-dependent oxidoreductase [Aliifodinibius sp. S!AR15-10]